MNKRHTWLPMQAEWPFTTDLNMQVKAGRKAKITGITQFRGVLGYWLIGVRVEGIWKHPHLVNIKYFLPKS